VLLGVHDEKKKKKITDHFGIEAEVRNPSRRQVLWCEVGWVFCHPQSSVPHLGNEKVLLSGSDLPRFIDVKRVFK
jgi:hypothetical protein